MKVTLKRKSKTRIKEKCELYMFGCASLVYQASKVLVILSNQTKITVSSVIELLGI